MSSIVFGDIPIEFSQYNQSRVVILPVPYEQTTSYLKGTAKGPEAILKTADQIELFDEKLKIEPFRMGIHILPFMDATSEPTESFFNQIEDEVFIHLAQQKLVVILGGEHTITLGGVKGAKKV
ncbi:MAG: arginase family protein, partial [Desulfobacterota bacterium]|nr:arginase family protein [Thermodesulfobacteriota bacterium]